MSRPFASQPGQGAAIVTEGAPGAMPPPVVCQVPWLLAEGPALWFAATGPPSWGGCHVLLSEDDDEYESAGTLTGASTMGVLLDALRLGTDGVRVLVYGDAELTSGDVASVRRRQRLCLITTGERSECLVYQTARLLEQTPEGRVYRLQDAMLRGAYGTPTLTHPAGASFVRCDRHVLRVPVERRLVSHLVYLKCAPFNAYGESAEDPGEAAPILVRIRGQRG